MFADPRTATEPAHVALSPMWAVVCYDAACLAPLALPIVLADLRATAGLALRALKTMLADLRATTVLAVVATTIVWATTWLLHCHRNGLVHGENLGILRS